MIIPPREMIEDERETRSSVLFAMRELQELYGWTVLELNQLVEDAITGEE